MTIPSPNSKPRASIALARLRPTQMTVGLRQVKQKRKRLRNFEKQPVELLDFILEHPIRVVLGPANQVYVIDHHHLALALIKENFETAPMEIEGDFSALPRKAFWKKMQAKKFVHPYDANGKERPLSQIPQCLKELADDPFRSLAGFVREMGGFRKVNTPFAEFLWADFYRTRIKKKYVFKRFKKALRQAIEISKAHAAKDLPGYI